VPILVVPDGLLWHTLFDATGKRIKQPTPTDRCSYFVNRGYRGGNNVEGANVVMSHLEFVTSSGLKSLVNELWNNGDSSALSWTYADPIIDVDDPL
jgi:hypothetical protein